MNNSMNLTYKFLEGHVGDMMNDKGRNQWLEELITPNCKDKVVLDIGAGLGLTTYYALKAGAKHVYAIEHELGRILVAKGILNKLGMSDRITWIHKNFWEGSIIDILGDLKFDVIISETFGGQGLDEGVFQNWFLAQQYLKEDGILLPDSMGLQVTQWPQDVYMGRFAQTVKESNTNILIDSLPKDYADALLWQDSTFIWNQIMYDARKLGPGVSVKRIDYSIDNLPEFDFSREYPNNIFPNIVFECTLNEGVVAVLPYIKDRLLTSFDHVAWREVPCYTIRIPGTYRFTWKRSFEARYYPIPGDFYWLLELVSPET